MSANRLSAYLAELQCATRPVSPKAAADLQAKGVPLIDIREQHETDTEIIPGAHITGRGFLEFKISDIAPDTAAPVILYCASGVRSILAASTLEALGYCNVMSLEGGLSRWKDQGFPTVTSTTLSTDERRRYARQISLPEVGEVGQLRLKEAKVLVVGAGGLGTPCLRYLAAAGVGHLGIVENDSVDVTNLQRQVLYSDEDVGKPKSAVAQKVLKLSNPNISIEVHDRKFDAEVGTDIARRYDVVIDCTDSLAARYEINDVAIELGIPLIHGSVSHYEGQAALLNFQGGACYRCLYPAPPPPGIAPTCSEAGVLGVVPGLVGIMQATIAIKLILGLPVKGDSVLVYDAIAETFTRRTLRSRPGCLCGRMETEKSA